MFHRQCEERIKFMENYINYLHAQIDGYRERNDRLIEAVGRKSGLDILMPQPIPVSVPRIKSPNPWKDPNPITSNFESQEKRQ